MSFTSTPGSITIMAVAMLSFPRALDPSKGPKNKVFDVTLNIKDGDEDSALGLIRYFVPDHLMNTVENMQDFSQVLFISTITAMPRSGPADKSIVIGDLESWSDYAFIGDVLQLIFVENVNNDYSPYVTLCGTVTANDRDNSSFTMRPAQYSNLLHESHELPAHLLISNSKRWSNKKPLPAVGSSVSVGGFLNFITRDVDKTISAFDIDIANIAYITARIPTTHQSLSTIAGPSTKRSSRARFDYKQQRPLTPTAKHVSNSTHDIELPSLKRKISDSETLKADDDDEDNEKLKQDQKKPHTE